MTGETEPSTLAEAVGREIAAAAAELPGRLREILALRDGRGLSHREIARVAALDGEAVPLLLARARLLLRDTRRGSNVAAAVEGCDARERSLRLLARRQDAEEIEDEDGEWLRRHLAECEPCRAAHAAMLEASLCYRASPPA